MIFVIMFNIVEKLYTMSVVGFDGPDFATFNQAH